MNDYLYDVDEAQYSFVRVPKLLLQHEAYQRISSEAKLLYSLLLDRVRSLLMQSRQQMPFLCLSFQRSRTTRM